MVTTLEVCFAELYSSQDRQQYYTRIDTTDHVDGNFLFKSNVQVIHEQVQFGFISTPTKMPIRFNTHSIVSLGHRMENELSPEFS